MASTPADLAFRGGNVYTMDSARRLEQAVAVRDGRIVAVGSDAAISDHIGPRTEVVDLRGRTLLPGFQDAHVHPLLGGLERLRCDLSGVHARESYLELVREYAARHASDSWIVGSGWYSDAFPAGAPTRHDLDAVCPDRPTFLVAHDAHGVWVNSAALEWAGLTADTPDPADGRIERDATGEPTGVLLEGAADLVGHNVAPPSEEQLTSALLTAQTYLHSLGITGWQDAIVGEYIGQPDNFPLYRALDERGQLSARVTGALWWSRERGLEQLDGLRARRGTFGRFRTPHVKIMQDGVCENHTAALLHPYLTRCGEPSDNRGLSFVPADELRRIVSTLDADGFSVHFHGVGDRAVRECLDAVEAAQAANGRAQRRHQLAHLDLVHPDDMARFHQLGVIANIQPLWARRDLGIRQDKLPYLGQSREPWHFPFGSLVRNGATLAAGSDWPVSSPNPLWGMHVGTTRTAPPDDPHAADEEAQTRPLLPEQRIPLSTALAASTIGAAYANHLDDVTGSIELGKYADLTLLDRELFDPELGSPAEAKTLLTLVGGQVVYESPDL